MIITAVSLSVGFQKPNGLEYCNIMEARGADLVRTESSNEIYSLVKLQRLSERIRELHCSKTLGQELHPHSLAADIATQGFLEELEEWRVTTAETVRGIGIVLPTGYG